MKIYLDNCCFNRPFDDQTQVKINLEAQAKIKIQKEIKDGIHALVWSYILDYEISKCPYIDRREAIAPWRFLASEIVKEETADIIKAAEELESQGVKAFDALHIACAKASGCDFFITTDKRLLKVALPGLIITNPIQFIVEEE